MKKPSSSAVDVTLAVTASAFIIFYIIPLSNALGSGATLAVSDESATVCGLVAEQPTQRIECYSNGEIIPVEPNISFSTIAGGNSFFCGLRHGNYSLICWDTLFSTKRIYRSNSVFLENLSIGDTQICTTVVGTGVVKCWRIDDMFELPSGSDKFMSISSGPGFACGILMNNSRVQCWGNSSIANQIQSEFGNMSMSSLIAGNSHVCGLNSTGFLICKGNNSSGQLGFPEDRPFEYTNLALGTEHTCAIRRRNGSVVCWGGGGKFSSNVTENVSFQIIVSGSNFTCGLITTNLSVICWGPGWPGISNSSFVLPLPPVLPGPCVQSSCSECGIYPLSPNLCSGSGNICNPCGPQIPVPGPSPSPPSIAPPRSRSKALTRGLLAFAIVGSVGSFAGISTIIYCMWTGICFGNKKIHNSVQPTITRGGSSSYGNGGANSSSSPPLRSSSIRRQGSRIIRRQRSGTSSSKQPDRAEEFTLAELQSATNNFSQENKIGAGSFGVVYRGKLADGREVAIKRGETNGTKMKKFQEKESAFESEIAFLSRLHHKHLVRLVGFCQEKEERLLVYEYMKYGALYDHLHDKNNIEKGSSFLNSWKIRIKIALDASRGIEYLHNYAVPPIIHRDIKSSNILLDANWTARVSDFGLSLMGPDTDIDFRPTKAAGTIGYIDPEYYGLNVLTAKSDVYGLGIVLLELLTGKRAIFRDGDNGGSPISVVDYAVPAIMAGELARVLDPRVGLPELNEAEAVELVAYTAMHCVNLEGKDRPTMADIVANLERAFAHCDNGSISSSAISIALD